MDTKPSIKTSAFKKKNATYLPLMPNIVLSALTIVIFIIAVSK